MTEVKRGPGRPATGHNPVRTIRMGDIWTEANELAKSRNERLADVIEQALKRYVARHQGRS